MITYNYNLSADFINGINPTCMDRTISGYGFTIEFIAILVEYATGEVQVIFDSDLSAGEKDDLDTLISVHNSVTTCDLEINANHSANNGVNFTMSDHAAHDYVETATTVWTTIRSFIYAGTAAWIPENFLLITSMSKSNSESGTARLFDFTNNNEISLINEWTGTGKQFYKSSLDNLPLTESLIELQVKSTSGGTGARVHYMALY